jgi:hypothetical protein
MMSPCSVRTLPTLDEVKTDACGFLVKALGDFVFLKSTAAAPEVSWFLVYQPSIADLIYPRPMSSAFSSLGPSVYSLVFKKGA